MRAGTPEGAEGLRLVKEAARSKKEAALGKKEKALIITKETAFTRIRNKESRP